MKTCISWGGGLHRLWVQRKHRTDGHHPRIFESLTSPSAAGAEASAISTSLVSSLLLIVIALGSGVGTNERNGRQPVTCYQSPAIGLLSVPRTKYY